MTFYPVDKSLEDVLKTIDDARDNTGCSVLEGVDVILLQELKIRGYIEEFEQRADGCVHVKLSYKGAAYFKQRQTAIDAGELLDEYSLSLLSDVARDSSVKGCYSCAADDKHAIDTLRFFGRKGLVKNSYGDNIPYITVITEEGRSVLAHSGSFSKGQGEQMSTNNSVYINVEGNVNSPLQVQQGSTGSSQVAYSEIEADKIIDEIIALKDNAEFNEVFGDQAPVVQSLAEKAKESKGLVKQALLETIRDIAVQVGATLITTGALALFSNLVG